MSNTRRLAMWFVVCLYIRILWGCCCSPVTKFCPTLCDPMNCSLPGLPVHQQLPKLTQTHVHWVGDAIQPSHPLVLFSSCLQSLSASGSFQMSKFFTSGGQSTGVSASASVLPSATPWTAAYQAPPPMEFCRQEYWSGVPLPSPKIS